MAPKRSHKTPITTLRQRVMASVVRVWYIIQADVDWPITLEEAAELCLDAHHPVMHGGMSREDYNLLLSLDDDRANRWAQEALRPYM